jgi:hypothetical protein
MCPSEAAKASASVPEAMPSNRRTATAEGGATMMRETFCAAISHAPSPSAMDAA